MDSNPLLAKVASASARAGRTSDYKVFLWSVSVLIALAWLILATWSYSPYGRYLNHDQLGELAFDAGANAILLSAGLYLCGWVLMTVAMMLPTILPLLAIFRRLTAQRPDRTRLVGLLIAGYLAIWSLFGIAAHVADWLLHETVERIAWLELNAWVIGAAIFLLAGLFQFSRLKYRCLEKCRTPLTFVTEHWRGRHDNSNALMLGVRHGLFCVGCCWALMLLMFAIGVGNLGWMLILGALMGIEMNMPWGRKFSAPLGIARIAFAVFTVFKSLPF
jgi:predicted metal-binding membrane protein